MTTTPPTAPALIALRVSSRPDISHLLRLSASEDATRPEDQDEHQDAERHHVLELIGRGDVETPEKQERSHGLEYPDDEAPKRCSADAADPPEHRRGEGGDPREAAQEEGHLAED